MALYELRRSARYEVVALLTTVAGEFDRVSHHGVRVELLEQQAAAVGVRSPSSTCRPAAAPTRNSPPWWKARRPNTSRPASGPAPLGACYWGICAPIAS